MDVNRARESLLRERAEVESLLKDERESGVEDRQAEADGATGDMADVAQPLTQEYEDESISERLTERLEAIDRALQRIKDGTYGLSIKSGKPIPDDRLEADPAAELTIEEARTAR
jgi:DnaK suppressor protein